MKTNNNASEFPFVFVVIKSSNQPPKYMKEVTLNDLPPNIRISEFVFKEGLYQNYKKGNNTLKEFHSQVKDFERHAKMGNRILHDVVVPKELLEVIKKMMPEIRLYVEKGNNNISNNSSNNKVVNNNGIGKVNNNGIGKVNTLNGIGKVNNNGIGKVNNNGIGKVNNLNGGKIMYGGKAYKLHYGSRGGTYIMKGGNKMYF